MRTSKNAVKAKFGGPAFFEVVYKEGAGNARKEHSEAQIDASGEHPRRWSETRRRRWRPKGNRARRRSKYPTRPGAHPRKSRKRSWHNDRLQMLQITPSSGSSKNTPSLRGWGHKVVGVPQPGSRRALTFALRRCGGDTHEEEVEEFVHLSWNSISSSPPSRSCSTLNSARAGT